MKQEQKTGRGGLTDRFSLSKLRLLTKHVWAAYVLFAFASQALTIPFTATGSLSAARESHTATLLPNGRVLVAGGYSSGSYLSSAVLYNPSNGTWTATGSMVEGRCYYAAAPLSDGNVLVAGGVTSKAERYNPSNEMWAATGSMSADRYHHTATLLPDGRVLVVGGYNYNGNVALSSAELYDPSNGTWTATGSMTAARTSHTATLLPNGRVLVAGGYSSGSDLASAVLYNPSNGTWTTMGSMASARDGHTATLLPNGKVLVAGGYNNGGFLSSAELYNPANGTWTATGPMTATRRNHTATLLPDRRVLVAGGWASSGADLSSAELYDPSSGTWVATGSMSAVRIFHTATLLPDGRVLVAGGRGNGSSSAELYGCTVTFDATGGIAVPSTKTYYSGSDAYGPLPLPLRDGYIFNGWRTQPDGSGTRLTESGLLTTNIDHTAFAVWLTEAYLVTRDSSVTLIGNTNAVNWSENDSGDGGTSIVLGGVGLLGDGQMAGVEWCATGPGILAFDWKVSSEADWDVLRFYEVGGAVTNEISGTTGGWSRVYMTINSAPDAVHTFRWEYEKDPYGDYVGSDCGWVDAVSWSPVYALTVESGAGDGAYTNGTVVTITADAPPADQKFCRWVGDTNGIANIFASPTVLSMPATNVTVSATYVSMLHSLTVINGLGGGMRREGSTVSVSDDPDPLWEDFAVWTGDGAALLADPTARTTLLTMPTRPATLTATYRDSVARVAGCYGRALTVAGVAGGVSADAASGSPFGTPAVKLGGADVVPDNGFAAFETSVSGSGTVTFWWRVSSESDSDYLKFLVDGTQIVAISGTKGPWAQVLQRIEGAGVSHTLRWEYAKNGSNASSTDAGWVDDIVWTGDVPEPVLSPDIQKAAVTNGVLGISFLGERGIPYTVYSNATLNASGWALMQTVPQEEGETNGVFRFGAVVLPPVGQRAGFYRIRGGENP